jgi:hypothetical protein
MKNQLMYVRFTLSKSERVKINVLGAVPFCQLTFNQPAKVSFASKDNVDWFPPNHLTQLSFLSRHWNRFLVG